MRVYACATQFRKLMMCVMSIERMNTSMRKIAKESNYDTLKGVQVMVEGQLIKFCTCFIY